MKPYKYLDRVDKQIISLIFKKNCRNIETGLLPDILINFITMAKFFAGKA